MAKKYSIFLVLLVPLFTFLQEYFVGKLDSVFSMPPDFDDSYYGFPIHELREMQIMNMGQYAHSNQSIQQIVSIK